MNILTFDVEEWFHILDHNSTKTEKDWIGFEYRLEANIDKIIEILHQYDQKATFFCLGWLTKNHKNIIQKLDQYGYEIATHSNLHQLIYEQKIVEFDSDLEHSIKSLEDITGKKVRAYRAPGFSLKEENRWVFDILLKHGIEIDCSIFPAKRDHGGFENFDSAKPLLIKSNNGTLKCFPMSLGKLLNKNVVYSGGGYFRFIPYQCIRYLMKANNYTMTYFHPHDFDPGRPVIEDLSPIKKFKAHVGLKSALRKLDKLIEEFHFIDIDEADKHVDWSTTKMIQLPERRKKQRL